MNMKKQIILSKGDITKFKADAMANAANAELRGGGGVDNAIHVASGPQLMEELKKKYPYGTTTGDAVITNSYGKIRAKFIIHTVGPVWDGGKNSEAELLYSAYYKTYQIADQHNCSHILMPAISCGLYGYPLKAAAKIAIRSTLDFLKTSKYLKKVEFVLFNDDTYENFSQMYFHYTSE